MKPFYRLLRNGLIILILLFAADRAFGSLIEHFFFNEKQGDSSVTTHGIKDAKEDILIFGSSRASHHYIPELISQRTGLTCYNLGRDGMKMLYYETLLKSVLSYHTPKIVILDLNLTDFENQVDEKVKLITTFKPYFNKSKEVRELIYTQSKTEFCMANISSLYRLNSLPISIMQHHLGIGQKNFNGYEPLKGNKPDSTKLKSIDNRGYRESEAQLIAFENFVNATKTKNIKLYVIVSPGMEIHKYNAIKTANRILSKYDLMSYDYSGLFNSGIHKLFYDARHLNEDGAKAFTESVILDHFSRKSVATINRMLFNCDKRTESRL